MAESFSDLNLGAALVAAAERVGYERPTPLQSAAVPVLRRGGNAVLHASSGAGVTGAFSLPLLDRLAAGAATPSPRALILTPTLQRADAVAAAVAVLAAAVGVAVRALSHGWRADAADVIIASPARALEAVETSELKLEAIESLVVTDAAELFALQGGAALETLIQLVPKDAQRVVTSAALDGEVHTFIEAHVRKALTIPARPAAPPRDAATAEPLGQIGYMLLEERAKRETLARLLESVDEEAVVYVRNQGRAHSLLAALHARGMENVTIKSFYEEAAPAARVISYDVPFTAEDLRRIHSGGGTVFVTPAERAHFRRIAGEAPFTVKQRRIRVLDAGELDAFRASVRGALQTEDLDSQLLVLEPLLDEFAAAEVAAALSALLRRRSPPAAQTAGAAQSATGAAPPQATAGGFTRLFVSVGARDNIRPGDVVGAITGEANIKGDQVGRVDIRESFSVVEVASAVAERVIRALNGTTMRGRSLRVDFDRKGVAPAGARERGGSRDRSGPRDRNPRDRSGPPRRRPPDR